MHFIQLSFGNNWLVLTKMYFTIMLESKLSEGYVVKNTQFFLQPIAPEVSVITHLLFICQKLLMQMKESVSVHEKQSQISGWRDNSWERPVLSMWKTLGSIRCSLPQITPKILLWLAFPLGILLWGPYWICIKPSNVLYDDHWPSTVWTIFLPYSLMNKVCPASWLLLFQTVLQTLFSLTCLCTSTVTADG